MHLKHERIGKNMWFVFYVATLYRKEIPIRSLLHAYIILISYPKIVLKIKLIMFVYWKYSSICSEMSNEQFWK